MLAAEIIYNPLNRRILISAILTTTELRKPHNCSISQTKLAKYAHIYNEVISFKGLFSLEMTKGVSQRCVANCRAEREKPDVM